MRRDEQDQEAGESCARVVRQEPADFPARLMDRYFDTPEAKAAGRPDVPMARINQIEALWRSLSPPNTGTSYNSKTYKSLGF